MAAPRGGAGGGSSGGRGGYGGGSSSGYGGSSDDRDGGRSTASPWGRKFTFTKNYLSGGNTPREATTVTWGAGVRGSSGPKSTVAIGYNKGPYTSAALAQDIWYYMTKKGTSISSIMADGIEPTHIDDFVKNFNDGKVDMYKYLKEVNNAIHHEKIPFDSLPPEVAIPLRKLLAWQEFITYVASTTPGDYGDYMTNFERVNYEILKINENEILRNNLCTYEHIPQDLSLKWCVTGRHGGGRRRTARRRNKKQRRSRQVQKLKR